MKVKDLRGKRLIVDMNEQIANIRYVISWITFGSYYFRGKSRGWLYNKMRGADGNGGEGGFTTEEVKDFRNALYDLSERIRNEADKLIIEE